MARSITPPTGRPSPGDRLTVRLERMAALGRAVARHQGLTVLVERGLPGEEALVRVVEAHPRYLVARVEQVLAPSPVRVAAPCAHFAACAGCDWQHLAYAAQLQAKRQVAQEQLQRIGRVAVPPDWVLTPAPQPLGYRDRLEFAVLRGPEGWRLALHGVEQAGPVPVEQCLLAPPILSRLAQRALALLPPLPGLAGALPVTRVVVQAGAPGEDAAHARLALLLHATADSLSSLQQQRDAWLKPLRAEFPALASVAVSGASGDEEDPSRGLRMLAGPPHVLKRVGPRAYRVPLGAFFQVHPALLEPLLEHVLGLLGATALGAAASAGSSPLGFDLFCGVGLFALPLSQAGQRVLGAEQSSGAVRAAQGMARDAAAQGVSGHVPIGQVPPGLAPRAQAPAAGDAPAPRSSAGRGWPRFVCVNLEQRGALGRLVAQHGRPDWVLVDPPRRGLAEPLLRDLLQLAPRRLVYVSCDVGTLARDAGRLGARYRVESLRGFDLFPQTHHLELVADFTLHPG